MAPIAEIAAEKAGIISGPHGAAETVAVIAAQPPEAMEVLLAQQSGPTQQWPGRAPLSSPYWTGRSPSADRCSNCRTPGGVYREVFVPLHGEHQAHNAVTALAAVEAFFGAGAQRQLDIDAVRPDSRP